MTFKPGEGRLDGALQENILCLLCFSKEYAKQARASLSPQQFESALFREVAGVAIDFVDLYGEPVGEHLPDHLEHILKGEDARKAASYRRVLDNLFSAREGLNAEYVMSQLHRFVRQQSLKDGFTRAVEAFEAGNVEQAELALQEALSRQATSFEPGLDLSDPEQVREMFSGEMQQEGFPLGIKELDRGGIMPRLKQLMMFVAPRKRGKSWFCTHVAKRAMIARWPCAVVTLEMSEIQYGVRFVQSFFSVSQREGQVTIAKLVERNGSLEDLLHERVERMSLERDKGKLERMTTRAFTRRPAMIIKEFPTGSLTMEELEAWLDGLERHRKVQLKCLVVDYPDLMKHDIKNKRLEIGQLIERLRGLGVKRNMAVVVVTQGNRESETASTVTADMAAEDISKLATADVALTYSQTPAEKALGLARILVGAARNAADGFSVLITQAYALGQFCLDSTMMGDGYSAGRAQVRDPRDDREEEPPPDDYKPRGRREVRRR